MLNILLIVHIYRSKTSVNNSRTRPVEATVASNANQQNAKIINLIKDNVDLSHAFSSKSGREYIKLFVLFPANYCNMCVSFETPYLKKIYEHYSNSIAVGAPKQKNYDLETIISGKSDHNTAIKRVIVSKKVYRKIDKPVILLINKKGLILLSRVSVFGNSKALKGFYRKITFIFSLSRKKSLIKK